MSHLILWPHVVLLYRGYINMPLVPLSHSCTLSTVFPKISNTLCSLSHLTIWQDSSRNADNRIFISRWETHRTLSYFTFFHYYLRQGCSPPARLCDSWRLFVFLLAKSFKKLWKVFDDMPNKYVDIGTRKIPFNFVTFDLITTTCTAFVLDYGCKSQYVWKWDACWSSLFLVTVVLHASTSWPMCCKNTSKFPDINNTGELVAVQCHQLLL